MRVVMQTNVPRARPEPVRHRRTPHRALTAGVITFLSAATMLLVTPAAHADRVIATIPVGRNPASVAITPDGSRAYVTNEGTRTLSVIDTATNTVATTVPVGAATGVVITPDGARAYARNNGGDGVSVIDTATNTVAATIPLPWSGSSASIAIAPNGAHVYATSDRGTISVIDTATNSVTDTIRLGGQLEGITVAPDGTRVYVTDVFGGPYGRLRVINTATNTVAGDVPVGIGPRGIAVTRDGQRIYVANIASGGVSVIDTATNTVTKTIDVRSATEVAITPDGSLAYVTDRTGSVHVINTATNTVPADPISVGTEARGVAITPNGSHAYVTNYGDFTSDGTVSVIAIETPGAPGGSGSMVFGS